MAGRKRRGKNDLSLVDSATALDERTSMLARRAYAMRQSGASLHEIADSLGLADGTVGPLIKRAIQEASELVTEGAKSELLSLEVARLDALQRAVWANAMSGDTRSVEAALKVIAARTKLLGLEQVQQDTIQQAVIVTGDSGAYIKALRGLVPEAIEEGVMQRVQLTIRRGEDYAAYVEWTDEDGGPIPADPDSDAVLQARDAEGALIIEFRSGEPHDTSAAADVLGTSGLIRLTAPRTVTEALRPGSYLFDLVVQHKDADAQVFRAGQRRYVLSGDLVVLETITRM